MDGGCERCACICVPSVTTPFVILLFIIDGSRFVIVVLLYIARMDIRIPFLGGCILLYIDVLTYFYKTILLLKSSDLGVVAVVLCDDDFFGCCIIVVGIPFSNNSSPLGWQPP